MSHNPSLTVESVLDSGLTGLRVLVAENDPATALLLERFLWDAGCIVLGPVASVAQGLAMLREQPPDAALLEVALADGTVGPLANALGDLKVPIALLTSAGQLELEDGLTFFPRVPSPFGMTQVLQALRRLTSREPAA